MGEYIILILLMSGILIIRFIWNWIKVKFILFSIGDIGKDKNSFLITIVYILSKKEIENIVKNKE